MNLSDESRRLALRRPSSSRQRVTGIRVSAVLAAGGTGKRMRAGIPKQFLELAGKPVLVRTVQRVLELGEVVEVVVALPQRHLQTARKLLDACAWRAPVKCVAGGKTRQDSVRLGIAATDPGCDVLLVHDAVRPLCDVEIIRRVVEAARTHGGAVPGLPAAETIQRVSSRGKILPTPSREELCMIQTPQCFRARILRSALEKAHRRGFYGTDESSIVRWAGHAVYVVPGSAANIKITRPLDLRLAEILLAMERDDMARGKERSGAVPQKREDPLVPPPGAGVRERSGSGLREGPTSVRVGHGMDYHRMVEGRRLVLGGVEIPFEKGLGGHSDADALLHAICDALLGAAAMGDIGRHFPDCDPANRDRSSLEFLSAVRDLLASRGWTVCNVDATLLAQRPKLAPYMEEMKKNIASTLRMDPSVVNVKATTTEGMNDEGRGEGISAHAVALLSRGTDPRR